jgi:hypothetical protein
MLNVQPTHGETKGGEETRDNALRNRIVWEKGVTWLHQNLGKSSSGGSYLDIEDIHRVDIVL